MRHARLATLSLLLLAHCGGQTAAAGADAAADSGIGAPCDSGAQCPTRTCLGGAFPGGYCAQPMRDCTGGCPAGSVCATVPGAVLLDGGESKGGLYCLAACSGPGDCRPISQGYTCCQTLSATPVCLPLVLCGN